MYDYLIIGSGLFGSIFAYEANKIGKKVLVIEKRNHIGGNLYTQEEDKIHIHIYGPHHFHTNNKKLWDYINQFATFRTCDLNNLACYKNKLYTLPINLKTFYELWGTKTEAEAQKKINQVKLPIKNPDNAEDYLLSQVGQEIYEIFFKGYTTRHWGKSPKELPKEIVKRIPIRFNFNCQYHNNSLYAGIPIGGYTQIFEKLLDGIETKLNLDFFDECKNWKKLAKKLVYTGPIDRLGNYEFGRLEYRSLKFERIKYNNCNYQGNPIVAYTDESVPYNRIVEHKFFDYHNQKNTIISKEYPEKYTGKNTPYYPVDDKNNKDILIKYQNKFKMHDDILIGGRLGNFKYYDMDQTIASSLNLVKKELTK